MATAIQRRRGNTAQHASFTGLAGEITIDTQKNTVVDHDGTTAGGHALAKASEVEALGGADITAVVAGNGLSGGATSGNANINVGEGTGIIVNADNVAVNSSYITGLFSATDAGGDGSFSYSSGVFTYTGPSQAEANTRIDARISGGTGVTYTSGVIAIGQAVGTTSNVTFNDMTVSGNLTVSGTTTTVNTETINLADNIILLNSNEAGTPSQNAGIEIERGTSANKTLVWDETADKWTVGAETFVAATFEGAVTGNVTGTVSSIANHSTTNLTEGTNLYRLTAGLEFKNQSRWRCNKCTGKSKWSKHYHVPK